MKEPSVSGLSGFVKPLGIRLSLQRKEAYPKDMGLLHGGFRATSHVGDEAPEIGKRLLTPIDVTGARPIYDEEVI
jgi:hypothetical protein